MARLLLLIVLAAVVVACGSVPSGHPASGPASSPSPASTGNPAGSGRPTSSSSPDATVSPDRKNSPAAAANSIIAGTVSAGPVTPISRPGHANSRPVPGVRVEALRDGKVMSTRYTDHEGKFEFTLRPGTYVIVASAVGFRSMPQPKTVTALADREQIVNFLFDTGIR